ncbi:hypothetical protein R1sor_023787 [Riccia sorocarpa]|uniref:F-box domain-containing protein n=1 Tax=Riccia sorocarpa TaxID=122646 RepID=A0ABD3GSN5_9MARC
MSSLEPKAMQSDDSLEETCSQPNAFRLVNLTYKDSSLVMDPSKTAAEHDLLPVIWQELPVELLNVVLTKLPASALTTFCLVSKSWKALIQSPEFAHLCSSVESVVCYWNSDVTWPHDHPDITKSNLKTGSWEKRSVDFGNEDLSCDFLLIAADHGLFCYRVDNVNIYEDEIFLYVHNPVTDCFRRIMVPYCFESRMVSRSSNSILGGLVMDQSTCSYKVVVAFIDADLTSETFIYDSSSDSWMVSAAISPALGRDDVDDDPDIMEARYITARKIQRSIRCGDELFWLVGIDAIAGWLVTLIKYNMKLDTWSTVSNLLPDIEDGDLPIHLASFENQVFMVNFNPSSDRISLGVSEFINMVPGMRKFGVEELALLLEQGGCTPSFDGLTPYRAVAGTGTWFVECYKTPEKYHQKNEWTVFAFSKNGSVIQLPRLYSLSLSLE